ncbi:formyltetrahydrofolate deformylase [Burkholderiaceae bacterium 26]|nr:formyltetrahydrofolate deformylase [Burkholderiaceae bacterium 26]
MSYSTQKANSYTLCITCPAATGLVAAVTTHLASKGCYISELQQYDDEETQRFFMRCVFIAPAEAVSAEAILGADWAATATLHSMEWRVRRGDEKQRVLLMVSKFDHCLRDLLYRWESGEMPMDVVGIVSNHEALKPIADRYHLPFILIPVTAQTKPEAEDKLRRVIAECRADLVVLARYMQILSDELSRDLAGHCINIHHSFLPSFKGGSPYAQAHTRGVKLIGATAHYVTGDLDEGPIIDQDVRRIDHRYSVAEMQALGRDIEAVVLARAVRMHLEDRVFIDGNKTIVFA